MCTEYDDVPALQTNLTLADKVPTLLLLFYLVLLLLPHSSDTAESPTPSP